MKQGVCHPELPIASGWSSSAAHRFPDKEHHDEYDHHHGGARERAEGWKSFFRARMHEH
jgi:hypothetical protein